MQRVKPRNKNEDPLKRLQVFSLVFQLLQSGLNPSFAISSYPGWTLSQLSQNHWDETHTSLFFNSPADSNVQPNVRSKRVPHSEILEEKSLREVSTIWCKE